MRKRAAAWACHLGELSGQLGDSSSGPDGGIPPRRSRRCRCRSGTLLAGSPMSCGRWSRSLTGRRICGGCGPGGTASSTQSMKNGGWSRSTTSPACRSPGISTRQSVTFRSWHPVIGMVRRGPVRGPSHPCKRCDQRHRRHDSVVSVQLAHPVHGAVVLIIRRSWVRAPPAPHALT
jgi:hypothetical protein